MSSSTALKCAALALLLGASPAWCQSTESEDPLATLRERGTVEIAVYAEFPPFSAAVPGKAPQGIDVDLAKALAQRLGLNLKLRLMSAGDSVSDDLRNNVWKGHYLGGGVADVMLHVGYDATLARRESNVWLFAPYFHESVAIAYKPSRIPHLESPIALTEHKIAVEGGTVSDYIMSSGYGGALRTAAVRKLSMEDAVAAFKNGEVDGVMGPVGELQGLLALQGVTDVQYHVQEPVGLMRTGWDLGAAVKNSGNPDLREAVAQTLASLQADGTLMRLFADHGVSYVPATLVGEGGR